MSCCIPEPDPSENPTGVLSFTFVRERASCCFTSIKYIHTHMYLSQKKNIFFNVTWKL